MVGPVKNLLDRTDAHYEYINIHQDDTARQRVREINDGFESVPTIVFADNSTLTEPSGHALKTKLESLGYEVQPRGHTKTAQR